MEFFSLIKIIKNKIYLWIYKDYISEIKCPMSVRKFTLEIYFKIKWKMSHIESFKLFDLQRK